MNPFSSMPALPPDASLEDRVARLELRMMRMNRTHWLAPWVPVAAAFVAGWFSLQGVKETARKQGKEAVRQESLAEQERRQELVAVRALKTFEKGHEQRTRQLIHEYLTRNEPMMIRP
jgi:hypothetical protein